jgi:rhodanese-related sulfurtransferase
VLGVLPGIIGTIQATEALKLILGIGDPLIGRFLVYDALKMRFRDLKLPKDPDCPVCGVHPRITTLRESAASCATEKGDRSLFLEMTVTDLKRRIDSGTAPVILDVREPPEAAICKLPGSLLIPLGELPRRLGELDAASEIVVHCKSGGRSARAVSLLREKGFTRASNLTGGILSWINEIDQSLTRY